MKKILNINTVKNTVSTLIFVLSFILLHYAPLNELHGRSDAALIIGVIGGFALIISFVFNLNIMSITTTLGYGLCVIVGIVFDSEGIVFDNKPIHTMWVVWFASFSIVIFIGLMADFLLKLRAKKLVRNYLGFFASFIVIIIIIVSYTTKPLTINDIYAHKPNFYGVVTEINESYMLLSVDQNSFVASYGDAVSVGFDTEIQDISINSEDFSLGDVVTVYFDGYVNTTYPLTLGNVYTVYNQYITIVDAGIKKNGDLYSYDKISELTGLSTKQLKENSINNPGQYAIDFLIGLRN